MIRRLALPAFFGFILLSVGIVSADMTSDFATPPLNRRTIAFTGSAYGANQYITTEGFGGISQLAVCANLNTVNSWNSPAFFAALNLTCDTLQKLGASYGIYDDVQFPSGNGGHGNANHGGYCTGATAGFGLTYPKNTVKDLYIHDHWVTGPTTITVTSQDTGCTRLMAVVAMDSSIVITDTSQHTSLIDLTDSGTTVDSLYSLTWTVPAGRWDVMVFELRKDPASDAEGFPIVDYLDTASCNLFVQMAYQPYATYCPNYIGTVINNSWYDEPSMIQGQRVTWTSQYNQRFITRWGFNPRRFYPALYKSIGPLTKSARNYLWGERADMYAGGFMRSIHLWDSAHGVTQCGHQDNEDWTDQVGSTTDDIKCFKFQDSPTLDNIGATYTHLFYKLFSAAQYNWDHPECGVEYGGNYGEAMEQLADGIIRQHSFSNGTTVTGAPNGDNTMLTYNKWIGRCRVLLQQPKSRHVADIAMLYPISAMQGTYWFDSLIAPTHQGADNASLDYIKVATILSQKICRDFSWLHPEILDSTCSVVGSTLYQSNAVNHEQFGVFIVPACSTIKWSNLQKIQALYNAGGHVIVTGVLPTNAAEYGHDADVAASVKAMFPVAGQTLTNANGGSAVFVGVIDSSIAGGDPKIVNAVNAALPVYDVQFTGTPVQYIHKVAHDSLNVYFFENRGATAVTTTVQLRGSFVPQQWDPHTGVITSPAYTQATVSGTPVTRLSLTLPALYSLLITGAYTPSTGVRPLTQEELQGATLNVRSLRSGITISYSVPKGAPDREPVTMQVFDVKGTRIAVLLDRQLTSSGTHRLTWAARRVPPGTYLIRLKVEGAGELVSKVVKQ
jgi:hypothetical protein